MKNFREKRKADKEYSTKENKRIENLRKLKVAKINSTEKASYKEKTRIRTQISRQKFKDQLKESIAPSSNNCSPYQCSQSFGKTLSKSMRALPKSPTKRKVVVQSLANHVGDIFKNSSW